MRFTAAALATVLGLVLPGAALAKQQDLRKCVHFSQSADDERRSLTFRVDNGCDREVRCSISWIVSCSGDAGNQSTATDRSATVTAGDVVTWEASAAACAPGEGYEISAPRWSCSATSR